MKRKLRPWVKLPTGWIENRGLKAFRWVQNSGADNIAALMALAAIAHHMDSETGSARLTYDDLGHITGLSRAKIAKGLEKLESQQLLVREPEGRSTFLIANYNPNAGWAKLPARGLYHIGRIVAFADFRLRHQSELDALKLYFLFVSRRDNDKNMAFLTYENIETYSGVTRNNIRRALSLLAATGLVHIEHVPSLAGQNHMVNGYRLAHLDTRNHMGTTGRGVDPIETISLAPDFEAPF